MPRRLSLVLATGALILGAPAAASADHPHRGSAGGTTATAWDDADWGFNDDGGGADPTRGDAPGAGTTTGAGAGSSAGAGSAGSGTGAGTVAPTDPSVLVPVPSTSRTVKGKVARLRTDGLAAIPRSAPKRVRQVIAAANLIVGKPYKWGGGHARLIDTGYDCSGAVSYALIRAGLLNGSMVSGTFAHWAAAGPGRWISVHANKGHVYSEIAGLRLDTSSVGDPTGRSGVRWRPVIGRRVGFHTRHIVGL